MRNSKLLIAMGLVITAVVSVSHLAGAGEPKSSGYSVEVSVVEEAGGQYLAKAIVRGAGNAVLAAPALRAKAGSSAQAESTGPDGSPRVTFNIEVGAAPTAHYEVQIYDGEVRVAHHQAKVSLAR